MRSPPRRRRPASSLPTRRSRSPSAATRSSSMAARARTGGRKPCRASRGRAAGRRSAAMPRDHRGATARTSWTPGRCSSRMAIDLGLADRRVEAGWPDRGGLLGMMVAGPSSSSAPGRSASSRRPSWRWRRRRLVAVRDDRLAAELGGAAGTLAALGDNGPEVLRLYADELDSSRPCFLAWSRDRRSRAALRRAGVLAKIGLDLALLHRPRSPRYARAARAGRRPSRAEAQPDPLDARARVGLV